MNNVSQNNLPASAETSNRLSEEHYLALQGQLASRAAVGKLRVLKERTCTPIMKWSSQHPYLTAGAAVAAGLIVARLAIKETPPSKSDSTENSDNSGAGLAEKVRAWTETGLSVQQFIKVLTSET